MNDSPPPWDALPHDPLGFFGLSEGFERRDLKRRYNALLRQFKPERFPSEFQRIRAAYELLDGQLRYGRQRGAMPTEIPYDWQMNESVASDERTSEDSPPHEPSELAPSPPISHEPAENEPAADEPAELDSPAEPSPSAGGHSDEQPRPAAAESQRARPLHERLETSSPEQLYKQLQSRGNKNPYEYYALALLSDVVLDGPSKFLPWLLAGLAAHPQDPGLFNLVFEYLQGDLPVESLPATLMLVAKAVPDDQFYYLTEKPWDTLLNEASSFDTFRNTLARCEQQLLDHRLQSKVVFYAHILRGALWKADDDWLSDAFAFIEDHYDDIPPYLEFDLELTMSLRHYQLDAEKFLNGDPLRAQIDEAIRAACLESEQEADRKILECHMAMAEDADAVLEAFPSTGEDSPSAQTFFLWQWLSDDVTQRMQLPSQETDDVASRRQLYKLMRELEDEEGSLYWNYFLVKRFCVLTLPYFLLAVAPLVLLLPWLDLTPVLLLALGMMVGAIALQHYVLLPRYLVPWFRAHTERILLGKYRRKWRARIVRFLRVTHLERTELQRALIELLQAYEGLTISTWLLQFLMDDDGVAFYALALRFVG